MTQLNIFDYAAAVTAREVAVNQVLGHNAKWSEVAMAALRSFAGRVGRSFTTEDFRVANLVAPPGHPNAWGALFNGAAKKGIIRQVGFARPANVRSHSSVVMTWESV
jgi:hypothetical protein